MDLVNNKRIVYKNNETTISGELDNPLRAVCYKYSKKMAEEFFKDQRLYFFFLALEPEIRKEGYQPCDNRRKNDDNIIT
jgi:hypothetical protein